MSTGTIHTGLDYSKERANRTRFLEEPTRNLQESRNIGTGTSSIVSKRKKIK